MTLLFSPVTLRGVTSRNRIVVSPMCQYSATDGVMGDWHHDHYHRLAIGGSGIVFVEASAVVPEGRITHGDVGIWDDGQTEAHRHIASRIRAGGAVPAIQLAHAGRKASMQRPWEGHGPLNDTDRARGIKPWPIVGPSAMALDEGWLEPTALSVDDIEGLVRAFAEGARRSLEAGYEMVEVHGAHGYLIQSFLSPVSNHREDAYGGSRENRMRFALEATRAVREVWPDDKPVFFRVSAVDGLDGGWELDDSVELARALKAAGVDVVDCSSMGNSAKSPVTAALLRGPGYQVPFAEEIRRKADVMTQAVGLILDGPQAEAILQEGRADLIAVARELLFNPFWPLHQMQAMRLDDEYEAWPDPYGYWLAKRAAGMRRAAEAAAQAAEAAE